MGLSARRARSIIQTLGGRSTCPGETGTTRRDSRVTIEAIEPFCDEPYADCKDLPPGKDAIFAVVLQNLSPSREAVR